VPVSQDEPAGNTGAAGSSRAKTSNNQVYRWFFTLKSDPHNSMSYMSQLSQLYRVLQEHCKEFFFQLEEGKEGYEHFQGVFSLKVKHRLNEAKNLLGFHTIHLEPCKTWWSGKNYCTKDETRVAGPWSHLKKPVDVKIKGPLREWQQGVLDLINSDPDDRRIHIYHDTVGKTGKSALGIHLSDIREDVLYLPSGRNDGTKEFVVRALAERAYRAIIFDVPRDHGRINWPLMEELKNGYLLNTRYHVQPARFNPVRVIVFTNDEIKEGDLDGIFSKDRLVIKKL